MKQLTLLRHAKSSWDDPNLDDFNRPLNDRGWKAARRMGRELAHRNIHFDLILASSAARVRETIDGLMENLKLDVEIRFEPQIYLASSGRLAEIVTALPETVRAPLLVGHNPGFHELALQLTKHNSNGLRAQVAHNFPTAAFARINFPAKRWAEVERESGEIVELILPKELD